LVRSNRFSGLTAKAVTTNPNGDRRYGNAAVDPAYPKRTPLELDVIIKNGVLILCEIKSSMSKSDMYTFWKKVRFYEKRHNRKADRALVISPMVDGRAKKAAKELNIEVYSVVEDVPLE
jgi:hypothetical protein